MTLKQELTIKALPKHNFNLSAAMKENGYSITTSKSGQQYERIRKHMKKLGFFDKEVIERDIKQTRVLAEQKQDLTNLCRIDEHRAKIAGLITQHVDNIVTMQDNEKDALSRYMDITRLSKQ